MEVKKLSAVNEVQQLLQKYSSVLEEGIGEIKDIQARLTINQSVKPIFCKARPVPFALKTKVEEEIENLVNQGVLKKVNSSNWATPVVPIVKPNGKIRLCGDFKTTINKFFLVDNHPLSTVNELFSNVAGGDKFTKIDLSQAYLHLPVHTSDRHLLTLNTHKGLYECTRLMFGVASATAIWQREIEKILIGIPGVTVFLDDYSL
ncbi:unnamed protein product [Macrosiphum euphorbiae]|uniref:Reverse transcriptase domain-containing protein n=1 Tax=Macrosiphum euphorbiae TaxID=13131 RepID=A0AAV0Y1N4_9HEMI|nr:unnamed protein product [Macrosiphum euphorbiae]